MPTISDIITIAKISQYLSGDDMASGALYGARKNPMLPLQLYNERKAVEYRYSYEGIATGNMPSISLSQTANYLYSLCDKYGFYALSVLSAGGNLPGITNPVSQTFTHPYSTSYTASIDGETSFNPNLPANSVIIQVIKEIKQTSSYGYMGGIFYFTGGLSLSAGETAFILYVVLSPASGNTYSYPVSGSYTASADGETALTLNIPANALVIQVIKEIKQINSFVYNYPVLTLLSGLYLAARETIFYLYVVPI